METDMPSLNLIKIGDFEDMVRRALGLQRIGELVNECFF